MIWILVALLLAALWVAAGVVLLLLGTRTSSGRYRRKVSRRVYTIGENVDVTLDITLPISHKSVSDHDVVLAIDHSSSMGGGPGSPLRESIRAAENFVRQLPGEVSVGIVGFDHEARVLSRISPDHTETLRALAGFGRGGGTAINLALDRCSEMLTEARPSAKKTVILLSDGGSDPELSIAASERLQQRTPEASVMCIGFGPTVDEPTMRLLASSPEKYVKIDQAEDLYSLFTFLAATVSGDLTSGIVEEAAHAPNPFHLSAVGGLYPIGVEPKRLTHIIWSIPLTTETKPTLSYGLASECPGWHSVASSESKAIWRTPDGTENRDAGPNGPRVLVLPPWMRWGWPIFNPLFWMIFGRWWRCYSQDEPVLPTDEVKPLPLPSFPALLPAPDERRYRPSLRPALVIGLGEIGEWTVCRLKDRIRDRGLESDGAGLVIRATHRSNQNPVNVGSTVITADECVEIHQDLRPYIESLRQTVVPSTRAWIPWRRWLTDTRPLTTSFSIGGERGKARLALLRKPNLVEEKVKAGLDRIKLSDNGVVIVVGSPFDAECSGLVAEVSHICAASDSGVTVVFTPALVGEEASAGVLALAQEIERMVLMSGMPIASDRHEPAVYAKQLFDRIIVIDQQYQSAADASVPASELIWDMLAYDEVFRRVRLVGKQGDELICAGAAVDGNVLPDDSVWRWVREHTLARGINGQRLRLVEKPGKLELPSLQEEDVKTDVEAFWSARETTRPANFLLSPSRMVLRSANPDSVIGLIGLQDLLPLNKPYHEQAAYCSRERQTFAYYLEEWCYRILERERSKGTWGMQALLAALLRVESDFRLLLSRINRASGNPNLAGLVSLASSMYLDFLTIIIGLRRDLACWLAKLTGPQLEFAAPVLSHNQLALCNDIEEARFGSEADLRVSGDEARRLLGDKLDEWYSTYGNPLLDQLRFKVALKNSDHQLRLNLCLDDNTEIGSEAELGGPLRALLDQYRNVVLSWPLAQLIQVQGLSNPVDWFRIGKHSRRVYPTVQNAADENDPFTIAAIQLRDRSLKEALGVYRPIHGEVPYVWPEEANAERISEKIRNSLSRVPQPFTPTVVHLMRDTQKLFRFMSDLGEGMVRQDGVRFVLNRNGKEYKIGPTSDDLKGLDAFQNVIVQVVSYETSLDGEPIEPAFTEWKVQPNAAVRAVESHPLGSAAMSSPAWEMWRDVIRGLTLEHGGG